MKPVYLLDTCIVSEPSRPIPNALVLERLKEHEDRCCISSFTWHELLYGIERLPESVKKRRLFSYAMDVVAPYVPMVDYDGSSAWIHAQLRAKAEAEGRVLPFVDGAIASVALSHNLVLVTRNVKDFSAIPNLYAEDWFSP